MLMIMSLGMLLAKNMLTMKTLEKNIAINSKAEKDGVLMLDGSSVMKSNLHMDTYKIVDLGDGSSPGDAVNLSQLLSHTDNHRRDYRLAPSFNFYRDFGDKAELTKSSLAINNHQHLDYDVGGIETITTDFQGFKRNAKMSSCI